MSLPRLDDEKTGFWLGGSLMLALGLSYNRRILLPSPKAALQEGHVKARKWSHIRDLGSRTPKSSLEISAAW